MGKKRKSKGKGRTTEPVVSGPFTGVFWRLQQIARTKGLYFLMEGDPKAPFFRVYESTCGNVLLSYWPKTRTYSFAGKNRRGGRCERHNDIIDVARTAAGVSIRRIRQMDTPGR